MRVRASVPSESTVEKLEKKRIVTQNCNKAPLMVPDFRENHAILYNYPLSNNFVDYSVVNKLDGRLFGWFLVLLLQLRLCSHTSRMV